MEAQPPLRSEEGLAAKTRILDILILSGIPALGYLVTFFYEAGYFDYFRIPRSMTRLSLTSVITATSFFLMVVCGTLMILAVLLTVLPVLPRRSGWLVIGLLALPFGCKGFLMLTGVGLGGGLCSSGQALSSS